MNKTTITFFKKEYNIPTDLIIYVEFLKFTEGIKDNLMKTFTQKIRNIENIENDDFMIKDINNEASKFITKLLEYNIYDKTVNDYLKNNKGMELFYEIKNKALKQIISIRQEKLDVYRSGVEDAIYKKESSVTGLDFGIITNSFTNAMIYSVMEASEETKQEKAALKAYNREIDELKKSLKVYDEQESQYIINTFIPGMDAVFTYLTYDLLEQFIKDLIRTNKFNKEALKYVDLERSNDYLNNLSLSPNKQAVIEQAFIACPFNIAVYMQALKYDLLDLESFKTAKHFKHDNTIIHFLKQNIGTVSYPDSFDINYTCVDQLALFTEQESSKLLYDLTNTYATKVYQKYIKTLKLSEDINYAKNIVEQWEDDEILQGESLSRGKAESIVYMIVPAIVWKKLTGICGHSNLLDRIQNSLPDNIEIKSKQELDKYIKEKFYTTFEQVRLRMAEEIQQRIEMERKKKEELRRQQEEERKRREEEIQRQKEKMIALFKKAKLIVKKIIKSILCCIAVVILLFIVCRVWIEIKWDVIVPAQKYKEAVQLMENGNYQEAYDIFSWYDDYKDSAELATECMVYIKDNIYNDAINLMNNKDYTSAITAFESILEHKDSKAKISECEEKIKEEKYNEAISLAANGSYKEAVTILTSLDDYKDSKNKILEYEENIKENSYNEAITLSKNGSYKEAVTILTSLDDYKDSKELITRFNILGCEIGDTITFGTYEQDNNFDNGTEAIEWLVLKKDGNKALIISKYCLENKPFNTTLTRVTWANSTIRKWLNNDFFKSAFSSKERAMILSSRIKNPDDEDQNRSGKDTIDNVFLLSSYEASIYFDSDSERAARATDYVATNHCYWILRTPASSGPYVCHVDTSGELGYCENVDREWWVRPAMWIDITD